MRKAYPTSPALSPQESLKHFKLEKGFDIRLVAAEPVVQAPVAMRFDEKGRIWVVEMQGYMPDTAGTGENARPAGDIVILEDKDHDGVMDHRKVFMDSLVLPRAICFYGDGLLMAEPPKLWFVKNNHDTAGAKYVVDSQYAVGGNVEHQANGLLRGLDNWIYSANSTKRYRRIKGRWVTERTHFRGQWGVSQDNYGRLFYNNNSANLLGDYFLPGLGSLNPDQRHVSGYNENIVPDNRTYPIHPTPGVNRGYQPSTLDDSLRLINFTAASGPVIYRGGAFGPSYEGNAFVGGPAANLVKRDILKEGDGHISGKQAYQGREFLASDDERFRPVSLYTGADGALYVVDMYRGIIQDVTYLTPYLKNEIVMRHLTHPLNRGRIYKIVLHGKSLSLPDLSHRSDKELVDLLDNPNSWVRATAQRLLVDGKKTNVQDLLRQKTKDDTSLLGRIHAFWALEGLGVLTDKEINYQLQSGNPLMQQQAVAAAVTRVNKHNAGRWLQSAKKLLEKKQRQLMPYTGFLIAATAGYLPHQADELLMNLALQYKNDPYVADAVISGLYHREEKFSHQYALHSSDTSAVFYKHLNSVIISARTRKAALKNKKMKAKFAGGMHLFETYCQGCHGDDGNGIRSLGAPLNGSPWVTGDKQRLLAIVLHGLTGPVKIGDKVYKKPEVSGEMPAFGQNDQLSDQDIAQILSFIRNAWNNQADTVNQADVQQAREANKGRQNPFTLEELK
ncbi:MAG TPA: c-type cytochrome [Chitinophagaceae bacterium]|nr:c-type cytochrome [Chitinophagaceae bacterium]